MNTHNQILRTKFPMSGKRVTRRRAATALISAASAAAYLGGSRGYVAAQDTFSTWTGTSSANWTVTGNWNGAVPGNSTTVAVFTGNPKKTNQPQLNSSETIDQLDLTNVTTAFTLLESGGAALTLVGSSNVSGIGLSDTGGNKTVTIGPPILLSGNQTWNSTVPSADAPTFDGGISTVSGNLTLTLTGGEFDLGDSSTVSSSVTLAFGSSASFGPNGTGNVVAGPVTLSTAATVIKGGKSTGVDFQNTISGNGGLSIQSGTTVQLDGTNTFTGPVAVQNGLLALTNGAALGTDYSTAANIGSAGSAGAIAQVLTDGPISVANYNFSSTITDTNLDIAGVVFGAETSQTGNSTFTGNFSIGAFDPSGNYSSSLVQLQAPAATYWVSFTGNISSPAGNNGGIDIVGPGTVILAGNNTYGGGTVVSSGTLQLASATALPSGGNISFAGGTLQYTSNNTNDYSADIVNSASPISIDTNGQPVTFASSLAATNTGGLTVTSSTPGGVLTLSASNAYSGLTTISGGTLSLNNPNAIPSGGNISFAGGTLQHTGNNTNDYSANILNSASPISIDTNGQSVIYASPLASTNTGGLTVTSSTPGGVLTVSASNSYTGATTINGGTVLANASSNSLGSGNVTVNSGGTLAGNGVISNGTNPITISSGAAITAGPDGVTPGTLTTGAQNWTAGGRFLVKIDDPNTSNSDTPGTSSTWDDLSTTTLAVTGSGATTATSFTIAPVGTLTGVNLGTVWTIATTSSAPATVNGNPLDGSSVATAPNLLTDPSGAFVLDTTKFSVDGVSGSPLANAFSLELVQDGGGDNLDLIYVGTPEPGVPLLFGAGLAPMLLARRRQPRAAT